MLTSPPLRLEMTEISKSFPGVLALDRVSFDCAAGEVHAICGENGAGKSTLIKILGGVYRPDVGAIRIDGAAVAFSHPVEARRAGISIIHQELSLLPDRTVAENIHLGIEPVRRGFLDHRAQKRGAEALLERLSSAIRPEARAGDLSVGEQQIVEIAKALAINARILVMDEPTAALDETDVRRLAGLVARLKGEGVAIVYISHRMQEVMEVADRITVLKDGKLVATRPVSALTSAEIVRLMVGRELSDFFPPRGRSVGAPILELANVSNDFVRDITLTVRAGEIVGIAGLEGSGKTALGRTIFGDLPIARGRMRFNGSEVRFRSPRQAIEAGIALLPDDRKREGLLLQQSVRDNALLVLRALAGMLRSPATGALSVRAADAELSRLDVRAASFDQEIRQLSGGNQQKTIIARWLARAAKLLIFAEPTRGIDVATKAAIYRIMRDLADHGRAVVMISSDLPEVIGVSDRIVVMREGRIVGECPAGASEAEVMEIAVGHAATAGTLNDGMAA